MVRFTFVLFLAGMILTANDCNITLDNLDEFVVNYEVTVVNSVDEPAVVLVLLPDVNRRQTLAKGQAVTVTGFKSGNALISASPARDVVAELRAKRDAVAARLDKKPLQLADSLTVYQELGVLNSQIQSYQSQSHGSLCTLELTSDKSVKHTFTLTLDFDKIICR